MGLHHNLRRKTTNSGDEVNRIVIHAPGEDEGHATRYYWQVESRNDILDCGTNETLEGAMEDAQLAVERAER